MTPEARRAVMAVLLPCANALWRGAGGTLRHDLKAGLSAYHPKALRSMFACHHDDEDAIIRTQRFWVHPVAEFDAHMGRHATSCDG